MKVAVDCHLANARESGMARFIREILRQLQREDSSIELVMIDYEDMRGVKGYSAKILALFKELFYTQLIIPFRAFKNRWPVMYFPNPPCPFVPTGKRVILNIPDLSFWAYEKPVLPIRLYQWLVYAASARAAKYITTFSESSANDIVRILKISRSKIIVIPLGVDTKFFTLQASLADETVKNKFGITRPYILSVLGVFVPRKNGHELIEAYSTLPPMLKKSTQLVIVAKKNDRYHEAILEFVHAKGIHDDIVFTGHVTEDELFSLYAGANMLAFPSKYEGFGLPPLEAMAAGVPAIAYNNSSLPEVIGNAGILVNNKIELQDAMHRLLNDNHKRNQLINAGKEHAKLFTWQKAAQSLLNVIKEDKSLRTKN